MKKNFPVTGVECPFPPGKYIVSKTDLKGVITYANDAFVELSGFNRDELIGKSHNLVRHPEMPPQAFLDLWETLKVGRPWRGIVKNRCKNGDHYWVDALVVPVRQDNQTIGFMSVRTEPSREQVKAAEALYARLNETGKALPRPLPASRFGLRKRLGLLTGGVMGALFLSCGLSWFGADFALDTDLVRYLVQGLTLLGLLSGAAMAWVHRDIFTTFSRLESSLDRIAQGDLSELIHHQRRDESGRLFDGLLTTQSHLKVMLAEIAEMADQVSGNADVLAADMDQVAQHSAAQSDAAGRIAAAIEEMSVTVHEVAGDAARTADAAATTRDRMSEVSERMREGRHASTAVVEAVGDANQTLAVLGQSLAQIGRITQAIQEVADQTNLIALNAAIEAARAGEAGRGFAVVADEVRKLAERTRKETQQITETVVSIHNLSQEATGRIQAAESLIGRHDAEFAGLEQGVTAVVGESREVDGMATHIASATVQQSQASQDISSSVADIANSLENGARNVESVGHSVSHLRNTAGELRRLIGYFRYAG
ncbi:aerotaxis receptor [Oryzomicrobium terrae]|uniref:Aerotaxis receptor n=1 Tax=Oryzomicrobium terrae TaxID=1735038 RepID=A0A5C1E9K2_9RHOO|nr:PAS domain-containing methyl-accepting chemotaxis protein [Oryzomicrobium terrae]QEL65553.1 aerotaxis receptor [Oryzomicrobium terrae]